MIAPDENKPRVVEPAVADPAIDPRFEELRRQRQKDWEAGLGRGQEMFKEGSLGRLGGNEDLQRVLAARRAQAGGLSADEQQVMRAKLMGQMASANQGALRQLRGIQGAAGIQGGVAGAQAADVLRGGQQAMIGAERDIQMQNLLAKRQGIGELEATAMGLGKYDIGQANKELIAKYQTGLAEQALGAAERGALRSSDLAMAQQSAANQGGKVLCTHFYFKGLLPHSVWVGDTLYGLEMDPAIVAGYHLWAKPLVRIMQRGGYLGCALEFLLWPVVRAWAYEMAFVMGYSTKGSLLGRIFRKTLEPVSFLIGRFRIAVKRMSAGGTNGAV